MDLTKCIQSYEVIGHSNDKHPIHLMFGVDSNFIIPFGIVMTSVLQHNHGSIIHLFIDQCSQIDKLRVEKTVKHYHAECHIYIVDIKNLGQFPTTKLWSEAIYYRLIGARCLQNVTNKVLYVDADTFCRSSLRKLFEIPMNNNYAAAVKDFGYIKHPDMLDYFRNVLHITENYFNSGVLLINLYQWNKDNISEYAINYILDNSTKYRYPDQDALNILMKNKIYWLPPKYNTLWDVVKDDVSKQLEQTCILHFTGAKPWTEYYYPNLLYPTRFDKEYRTCYEESAWKDTDFLNPSLAFSYRKESEKYFHEGKVLLAIASHFKYFKEKIKKIFINYKIKFK